MTQHHDNDLLPSCPDKEQLYQYSLGLLSPAEMVRVAEHLEGCSRCLDTLQALDDRTDVLMQELREYAQSEPSPESDARHLRRQIESISQWSNMPALLSQSIAGQRAARETVPQHVGPFELLEPLGQGGMGRVYRARHCFLDRPAAVKLLPPEQMENPVVVERFRHIPLPSMVAGNLAHSALFEEMCRLLKERLETEALYAVAFPLRGQKPLPLPPP